MKKAALLFTLATILLIVCNCESPEITDDSEDQQEEVEKPDKGKNNGDNGNDNKNDSTSTKDNDDSDDGYTDPDDGTDPNYGGDSDVEEHDFVDGNDNTGKQITTGDTLNCSRFINADFDCGVYVVGYIVGACTKNISNADFKAPFSDPQAILIADKKGERDTDKLVSIELKSGGKFRTTFNLKDNPDNLGRRIIVFGYKTTYLKIDGIKSPVSIDFFD